MMGSSFSKIKRISSDSTKVEKIRRIWRNYGQHKNWKKMVLNLHDYIKNISSFKDAEDALEPFDMNKLKLVCLDFIP